MNAEGFVHTHQHDGPAHAEGWPFPLWQQAGGIGWHFAPTGVPGYDAPHATPDGWTLAAARGQALSAKGWPIELTAAGATAQTPAFAVEARAAPWLRLNWWASGLERANPYVEWTAKDAPEFSPDRRLYFSAAGGDGPVDLARGETRSMLPMYRLPAWKRAITGLRIGFDNPGPAQVVIKSFHTACDTRQNINNSNFIRGCHDYFLWTSDLTFLRGQIGRIRTAMRFMMREFDTRARKCVYTTWPGHEGRSGVRRVAGKTVIATGEGIGSNYFWGWSNPESVPWGNQVQDGGAVLGFSYHDLMARLKTAGPDDAWQRLARSWPGSTRSSWPAAIASITRTRRGARCKAATCPVDSGSTRSSSSRSSCRKSCCTGFSGCGRQPTASALPRGCPPTGKSYRSRGFTCATTLSTCALRPGPSR